MASGIGGGAMDLLRGGFKSQVGIAGQFFGAATRAFGQVALGECLHAPSDAFDEPDFVAGAGGFAEDLGEALSQLADTQTLQRSDFVGDIHFHTVVLSLDRGRG
jgi:hypothetical protein